jgi:hypothetical protein
VVYVPSNGSSKVPSQYLAAWQMPWMHCSEMQFSVLESSCICEWCCNEKIPLLWSIRTYNIWVLQHSIGTDLPSFFRYRKEIVYNLIMWGCSNGPTNKHDDNSRQLVIRVTSGLAWMSNQAAAEGSYSSAETFGNTDWLTEKFQPIHVGEQLSMLRFNVWAVRLFVLTISFG